MKMGFNDFNLTKAGIKQCTLIVWLLFWAIGSFAQQPPVFFVDSVRVASAALQQYAPADIASVMVMKKTDAVKWLGNEGNNGAVIITTKAFARKHYWQFLSQQSADYARAVRSPWSDSTVQYVLNGKPLKNNMESDLEAVNKSNFMSLVVISGLMLEAEFQIKGKQYGVIIQARRQ